MANRFDALLKTLTNNKIAEHQTAADNVPMPTPAQSETAPTSVAVPKGRTTLTVQRKGGTVTVPLAAMTPASAAPPTPIVGAGSARPAPAAVEAVAARPSPPPTIEQPAAEVDRHIDTPTTDNVAILPDNFYFPPTPAAPPRSETSAALHVKATRPKKPKADLQPNDMILTAYRMPKYLKDAFDKTCHDRAVVPTDIIRNFIKTYCGF
jgi:hypothetical protein